MRNAGWCVWLMGAILVLGGSWVPSASGEPAPAANEAAAIEAATALENAFTAVAARVSPAVVVITNKQQVGLMARNGQQVAPEFRFFFGIPESPEPNGGPAPRVPQPVGRGSGVVISADGYIVTNYHVIKDYDALEVKLHDGTVIDTGRDADAIKVVGTDAETDLAVLKIDAGKVLPALKFADSDKVRVGQWAIAVGAPFNFDYSVTVGVVSQKGRYDVRMNTYENYIQTDASINPGNSGGPLVNLRGEVIGINDFIVTGGGMSRGNVGLGFAIASNLVKQVVDDIVESGAVVRPWLGIAMQPMTPELRAQFDVEQGVLISDVMPGDPAEAAGLKAGDVILQVGGKRVRTPHDVQFAVLGHRPGDAIPVQVSRMGGLLTVQVTARHKDMAVVAANSGGNRQGDILKEMGLVLDVGEKGVMVMDVAAGSVASAADVRRGDMIHEVNRKPVASVDEVVDALNGTRHEVAVLYIERRGAKFFVPVNMPGASD